MLITQKPHRKCPLSLTEEVHIPSYTDKRRSTKTFRRGQRREDYHNLLVCIPCKLSVCPFPSLFLSFSSSSTLSRSLSTALLFLLVSNLVWSSRNGGSWLCSLSLTVVFFPPSCDHPCHWRAAVGVIRQWQAKRGVTVLTDPSSCYVIVNPQPSARSHCCFHPSILHEGDRG